MRATLTTGWLLVWLVVGACGGDTRAPLEIEALDVVAPLPGSRVAAAYMTLSNTTTEPIVIERFTSPEFESVELHETRIEDGVARMHALTRLEIPPESSIVLESGGMHLMLVSPLDTGGTDRTIALHFHYDDAGVVIASADMRPRLAGAPAY